MITVEEAEKIVMSHVMDYGEETINIEETMNKVLREDISADRDFPPFNRVTMDGIAINFEAFKNGKRTFKIEGVAAAGSPQMKLVDSENCLEVMTGAILPENVDTVIRYEDIEDADGIATIIEEQIKQGQNIHGKGEDRLKGDVILKSGTVLSAAEIGVIATVGKAEISVSKTPRTIIISSGDELVEIDEKPKAHQIRKSNVYSLLAYLKTFGVEADQVHLTDDLEDIKNQVAHFLENYDVIILSGGVSKGKFDFIPQAMDELGVEKLFHKIKQRPGKPFWFGKHPDGPLVFALPGNPVSSFMCFQCYILPWLKASLGIESTKVLKAKLAQEISFKPELSYFMQVKVEFNEEGTLMAIPVEGHGSGDLANLADADAFLELPMGKDIYEKGEVHKLHLFRKIF
ncbi:MAG: molybdopterin molybdenumtransferase MoeA [Thalassobius sp.]|nr:molybdopterin molybdenumtransferase MoeA [Thalassovita sp.]